MSWVQAQMFVVDGASSLVRFAANWLLQSSLLILAGLCIGWCTRRRGSAVQSVVYRTTLLAVLICPLATWVLSLAGVSGWSVDMPVAWNKETADSPAPETVALVSPLSEPKEATPGLERKPHEQTLPVRRSGVFPEADVRNTELSMPPDLEAGSLPVEDFSLEESPPEADDAFVGTDTRIAERAMPIAATSVSEQPTISVFGLWAMGLCFLWAVIALALSVRLGWAWRRMARLCRHGAEADAALSDVCRELASMLCVSPPKLLFSPYVSSPCLGGLSQPTILLPELEPASSVRDVLIHELAHLRRRDCHWNLLRQLVTAVFFFQPLLWKLGRRLEATAEEVCDDHVVQFGGDRTDYAIQLLDMAERRLASLPVTGVGMLSLKSLLARRVMRVLDTSRSLSTRVGNMFLIVVVACGFVGTTVVGFVGLGHEPSRTLAAQGPDEKSPEPAEATEQQKPLTTNSEAVAPKAGDRQESDGAYRGRVVGMPTPIGRVIPTKTWPAN